MARRLLVVAGAYPRPDNLTSGVFITRRLRVFRELGIDFDVVCPVIAENWDLRLAERICGFTPVDWPDALTSEDIEYRFLRVPLGVFGYRFGYHRISQHMADALARSVDPSRYDAVLSYWSYAQGHAAKLFGDGNGLAHVVVSLGDDVNVKPIQRPKVRPLVVETLESAHRAVFVSQGLCDAAVQLGYSGANAAIIPNGVDTDFFHPMDRTEARRRAGIPEGVKCVGFVGSLIPIKRADAFPAIFRHIRDLWERDVRFLLVGGGVIGDGDLRGRLEKECAGLDVTFTGRVPANDVAHYMNAMDVMIIPSRNEGWPCVVLEAQACGTTVVGSDRGGTPEAVGDTRAVVPEGPDFERRFAEAVVARLHDPFSAEALVARAREHSWKALAGREAALCLEAMERKGKRHA